MKLNRHKPCNECPFRKKSIAGWLGPWDITSILFQSNSEAGLPCHKSYDPLLRKGLDPILAMDKAHVCVGSLQSANASCKRYSNPVLKYMAEVVVKSEDILSVFEFRKHHEGKSK